MSYFTQPHTLCFDDIQTEDLVALRSHLLALGTGDVDPDYAFCGLCMELKDRFPFLKVRSEEAYNNRTTDLNELLFKDWKFHSGDPLYPVPAPEGSPAMEPDGAPNKNPNSFHYFLYTNNPRTDDDSPHPFNSMWGPDEYGRKRRNLCLHAAHRCYEALLKRAATTDAEIEESIK